MAVSGSSTVMPLAEMDAEEFNMLQNAYHVTVTSGGTGVGIVDMAEGRSEIAMASREIKPSERMSYEIGEKKIHEFIVAYDAICIVVSPEIYESGIASLTREQLREIYSGNISNWKDVDGPDSDIFVIGRRAGSGTRDTFNEIVMGSREAETPGVSMEAGDSSEAKTAIKGSNNAISYLGYSYVRSGDMNLVALEGVNPTIETIKNGDYPLARKLYFFTMGDPKPGARAFIDFVLSHEGEKIAIENGFIPAR
ncbi:MAG: PstS family phosphate ABC transporter substrate-binding protein [Methanotrichaceae archaeon]|nr:PstS family phosphate ABC transporter substrate-binding protein [Methanotrichaceae archaeon]